MKVAFGFLLLLSLTARARLGEVHAEIEKRIGEPLERKDLGEGAKLYLHKHGRILFKVYTLNGKSVQEQYEMVSLQEANAIMAKHLNGAFGNAKKVDDGASLMWAAEGGHSALYRFSTQSLTVTHCTWVNFVLEAYWKKHPIKDVW